VCEFTNIHDTPFTDSPAFSDLHRPEFNSFEVIQQYSHWNAAGFQSGEPITESSDKSSDESRKSCHEIPMNLSTAKPQPNQTCFSMWTCHCGEAEISALNSICSTCGHRRCIACCEEEIRDCLV
jgi:hypothetical protein